MNYWKYIGMVSVSVLFAWIAYITDSVFFSEFCKGLIPLLATLLAINIATSSIIASRLLDIQKASGHNFGPTKTSLKNSYVIQIVLIGVVFVVQILSGGNIFRIYLTNEWWRIISDALLLLVFIVYIEIIVDLGRALFAILDYNEKGAQTPKE